MDSKELKIQEIETDRLQLRTPQLEHLNVLTEWNVNTKGNEDFLKIEQITQEELYRRIQSGYFQTSSSGLFIIHLKNKTLPIGYISFWEVPHETSVCNMTIRIPNEQYRNIGIGTEAQSGLIDRLFSNMKYQTIEMYTDVDNRAQQRCLEKLNFTFIKAVLFCELDQSRVGRLYRMTASDWRQQQI